MAMLPTRFEKSVIFKLFTLVKMQEDELTSLVIVLPLTSIMEDQIKDFEDLGISAVKLSCDEKTLEEIAGGNRKYRVISVPPRQYLMSVSGKSLLERLQNFARRDVHAAVRLQEAT